MSRYLRRTKPATPGRVFDVGPAPRAERGTLDHTTWHARLAGWNRPAAPSPAEPGRIVRPGWGRKAAA